MKIKMEFKRGILFIRLTGKLENNNVNYFEEEVLPVLLLQNIKYIVLNFDEVTSIDSKGINSLDKLNDIVSSYNGKTSLCSLTSIDVRNKITENSIYSKFYETTNELSALELFKI